MIKSKNTANESGRFTPYTLLVIVIAICATGAAVMLMPGASGASAGNTTTYTGSTGYLPTEFVNQAKEIEPETAYVLEPAAVVADTSPDSTTIYAGRSGYFPNEFINQAKEVESQPATF